MQNIRHPKGFCDFSVNSNKPRNSLLVKSVFSYLNPGYNLRRDGSGVEWKGWKENGAHIQAEE
jgi:hypothetical protein